MMMFPHTVTVYNVEVVTNLITFEDETINHITVLKGVLLEQNKAANVNKSGIETADAVNLYIPKNAVAVDGISGVEKQFVGPLEFWRAENKDDIWTLSLTSKGVQSASTTNCFFIDGEVVEPDMSVEQLELLHDGVYDVTKVDVKNYGSELDHIEVGGA